MDALDSHKGKATQTAITLGMMRAGLSGKDADAEKAAAEFGNSMDAAKEKDNEASESIVMLKAKLIPLRDAAMVREQANA